MGQHRLIQRYRSKKASEIELSQNIQKLAYEKKRYGYRRIHILLKRRGLQINHKKVYRIYKVLGLKVVK